MTNKARTQESLGGAAIIDRRRFLKQTALATAVVSVPYLAGKTVAFGKENAKDADAALDRALEELVAMDGGPQVLSPSCSGARAGRSTPSGSVT
jgi:hypothetical protein